jgi:poly-gamma-glutamate capsule biosynthesis protein CapA/YwtB (metallophosphatase superfamily)
MSNAPSDPRRAELGSKALVVSLVAIFLFGMFGFALAVIDARGEPPTEPAPPSLPAIPAILPAATASDPPSPTEPRAAATERFGLVLAEVEASLVPGPSADPSPEPSADAMNGAPLRSAPASAMPIVPVTRFWSTQQGITSRDVRLALETGTLGAFKRVMVEDGIADELAGALAIEIHPDVQRGDPARVGTVVGRGALGFLSATHVTPSMRLLELDGVSLVGNDRVRDIADWPLSVVLEQPADDRWQQERTWVLVAGGDSFTDRGVYQKVVQQGKGVDYPFDGGTARVTGHGCCDPVFNDNIVPRYVLTGNKGMVRRLFRQAELAIANHEQPVTDQAVHHTSGLRFSGKPALTRIFTRAGIDYLSLANNHIKDFGADGIEDTRRILRRHGIAFGGAGKDLEQARRISYLAAGDTRVAIIPCLGIVRPYWAGTNQSGATPCLDRYLVPDIKKATRQADVVIVFPHWGVEYTRQPLPSMRKHAARWAKAGADLILGAHSHVAGAIEDIDGTPVLYSLGNLIFDQHWSTNTMESALLEATFHGDRLIEMRLRPYIIHDTSQPNLLDPARGEGRRLLLEVKRASAEWLDW